MSNPNDLLTTLSQSSAVMVAIIGGFLVSRLVALSSEREGIRRQLRAACERLALLQADYGPAYEHRLHWSQDYFDDMVVDKLIEDRDADIEELIKEYVPRGSSMEEITPYAHELNSRVDNAFSQILGLLHQEDGRSIDLDDLKQRGLKVSDRDEYILESVLYQIKSSMPSPQSMFGPVDSFIMPPIQSAASQQTEARRFDDAVKAELELAGQITATEHEIERLDSELTRLGRPVGVVSATWMLAILSVTGIVVPVVVMAMDPTRLAVWVKVVLIALFVVGLAALLLYIIWYLKHLDNKAGRND